MDLIKDNGHHYFIKYLDSTDSGVGLYSKAQACFVLCAICDGHIKVSDVYLCAGLLVPRSAFLSSKTPLLESDPHALL